MPSEEHTAHTSHMRSIPTPPNKHEQRKMAVVLGSGSVALLGLALIGYHYYPHQGGEAYVPILVPLGICMALASLMWWFGEFDYDD